MRFPIDVIFIGKNGKVAKLLRRVPPWRVLVCWGGRSVVELSAGALDGMRLSVGDPVRVEEI